MANPYPGPRAYTQDEDGIFAGRDHDICELASLIVAHQVTLLYAQSGAGKTSIVNAGLNGPLRDRDVQILRSARVGIPAPRTVPLESVANVYTYSAISGFFPDAPTDAADWRCAATLSEAIKRLPREMDEFEEPKLRLLVLDQFEEIFTAFPQRWQDREGFFQQLSVCLRDSRELRVLLVLREDYLAAFNNLGHILPEGARARYRLERLEADDAIMAVEKPLETTPVRFDTGVAAAIVEDLMAITVAGPDGSLITVPGEYVEPVQLQVVCFTLFERLPSDSALITIDAYRRFGDPDKALETFYVTAVEFAASETTVSENEIRDWCESQLITPAGTRGLVYGGRNTTAGISNEVVRILEHRHLLRPEMRSGIRWYELSHDRFIRPIQNSNLAWKMERWSKSFDVEYAAAIREATAVSGIGEHRLRAYLDTLAGPSGQRLPEGAADMPERALNVLVAAGLLFRQGEDETGPRYVLVSDSAGEAIRLANQSWRGENWSEAKLLSELRVRAADWRAASSDASLLRGAELERAHAVLELARSSGVRLEGELEEFVDVGLRRESKRKLGWALSVGALGAAATVASLFAPADMSFRSHILAFFSVAIGAAAGLALMHDEDDDVIFLRFSAFVGVVAVVSALGLIVVPVYRWTTVAGLLIAPFFGFMSTAFTLGVVGEFRRKGVRNYKTVKARLKT
jgi:hypothetical protein